ncbi:MAG: ParB N-terminal domain-containing protein [Alphaproteobacteria bacterium]|nr:ParB N-terminal domain-containing protein [Alphaproteobacteria bacterium]
MMEVNVDEIIVLDRIRQNNGFLDTLERSIQQVGVLQPVGITPGKHLIFGGRRLQACKNLGLNTIPVRVFDIAADDPVTALRMEREENEHRMDLTPSEKVEVAKRIEGVMEGRRGSNQYQQKVDVPILAQAEPGTKTREIAAKAVDMKPETYRKAKAVVDTKDNELIRQMDTGEKSIHAAYKSIPKPEPEPPKPIPKPAPAPQAKEQKPLPTPKPEENPNKQRLSSAIKELELFRQKYGDLQELFGVFQAIDEIARKEH